MAQARILIGGASGMIGSLLVDDLLGRGVEVGAMLRPGSDGGGIAAKDGVTAVEGDFDDPASLRRALDGVERAFLLTNSSERAEAQQLAFVAAAADAGVHHVVKLSQFAATADSPVRFLRYHAAVEAALEASGMEWTMVRPNLIAQAYLPFAPMIAKGVLQAPIGEAAVSVVDARDIAAVAATALSEDGHAGRIYTVTGPAAVTHAEIAAAIGAVARHPVEFQTVAPADFLATLTAVGMPQWQAEGLVEDYGHYDRGEASAVSPNVAEVTGTEPRSIEAFAADHADAFAS
jgi:uncharacterized protein YbjT (DUF2867 family)